jgi:hypothetical protein
MSAMSAERYYSQLPQSSKPQTQRDSDNMEIGLCFRSHYCASCFRENTVQEPRSIIVISRAVVLI